MPLWGSLSKMQQWAHYPLREIGRFSWCCSLETYTYRVTVCNYMLKFSLFSMDSLTIALHQVSIHGWYTSFEVLGSSHNQGAPHTFWLKSKCLRIGFSWKLSACGIPVHRLPFDQDILVRAKGAKGGLSYCCRDVLQGSRRGFIGYGDFWSCQHGGLQSRNWRLWTPDFEWGNLLICFWWNNSANAIAVSSGASFEEWGWSILIVCVMPKVLAFEG